MFLLVCSAGLEPEQVFHTGAVRRERRGEDHTGTRGETQGEGEDSWGGGGEYAKIKDPDTQGGGESSGRGGPGGVRWEST